jgi:hypothetical protein
MIEPFFAEAFLAGYTKHGTPEVTERAWKCSHLLLQFAEDNSDDTGVLGFVESQAELEGLYNQIFVRRDHLWQQFDILIRTWAKKLSLIAPYSRIIAAAKNANKSDAKAAIGVVILALLVAYPELETELRNILTRATQQSQAEGIALATALLAIRSGKPVPDMQELVAASLKKAKQDHRVQQGVGQFSTAVVGGMAGDLALSLTAQNNVGAPDDHLTDVATTAMANGDGPGFYTDQNIQGALVVAALAAYRRAGIGNVSWISMGDMKVCAACDALEAGSPYTISELPETPPEHGGCRCFLSPA